MRKNLLVPTALAAMLAFSGLAQAQASKVTPDASRPTSTNIAAPADQASAPKGKDMKKSDRSHSMKGDAQSNAAVGSGSAGTVVGRAAGTTNSNSKGEMPKTGK